MERSSYTSAMQAPRLVKIVVNMGVGDALTNVKLLDARRATSSARSPASSRSMRRAKKSISNFKLREGMAIGCMVTLRGARMCEFYDRLVNVALPRIRDFRGINPRSFDGRGNYTLGLTEQIIFPGDQLRQGRRRSAAWTSRSSRPRRPTRKGASCCGS